MRNLSFKTDDDFDDKLYSISKKKGMTKSAFIKHELGKLIEAGGEENLPNKNFSNSIPISDTHVDILKEEKKNNFSGFSSLKTEESQPQVDSQKKTNSPSISPNVNSSIKPNESAMNELNIQKDLTINKSEEKKVEKIIEEKKELNDLSILKNLKQEVSSSGDDGNRLDNLVISKTSTSESKLTDNNINIDKSSRIIGSRTKPKFRIGKVKRVNDEESMSTGITERDIEHKVNKLLEEKKFNESFKDMHGKVDKVCEDGKCLRNEMDSLKNKLGKIDDICEDGKCIKTEVSDIKNDLKELKEFKKSFDELKGNVVDIKSIYSNLDKKIVKKEPCPTCNSGIEEGSSYCPTCGLEIKEWYDEKGNKLDWTPYKLRHNH